MSTHAKAAAKFIADRKRTAWHDNALFFVREKRDKMAKSVPEWEELREAASQMKRHTLSRLADYLEEFERNAVANGMIVHWAEDAEELNRTVYGIIEKHGGKNLVKSKSMLAEECGLSPYLESKGVDAVETDLGERIMQFMGIPPSHIVLPAIHVKREEVGKVFEEKIGTEKDNSDPTYLTHAARLHLREKFLNADISMTGVNFAVASEGSFVVCTNEGNADMGTSFPDIHIAIMGMEKVVPDYEALGIYTRLLARSATGQPITTYTSHFGRPHQGGEQHFIIVDNGRSKILGMPEHRKVMNCIRCGACMNTCPVYRRSGGYSYSYFIPGPIGINLGMLNDPQKHSGNVSACSLCLSCSFVCPAMVDLGEQIYIWRQKLDGFGKADPKKKVMCQGIKYLMDRPKLFHSALKMAPMVNSMPRFMLYNGLNDWGKERELPKFAKQSFEAWWKKNQKEKNAK